MSWRRHSTCVAWRLRIKTQRGRRRATSTACTRCLFLPALNAGHRLVGVHAWSGETTRSESCSPRRYDFTTSLGFITHPTLQSSESCMLFCYSCKFVAIVLPLISRNCPVPLFVTSNRYCTITNFHIDFFRMHIMHLGLHFKNTIVSLCFTQRRREKCRKTPVLGLSRVPFFSVWRVSEALSFGACLNFVIMLSSHRK